MAVGAMAAAAAAVGSEKIYDTVLLTNMSFSQSQGYLLTRDLKELAQCRRGARGERGTAAIQNVAVRAIPEHAGVAAGLAWVRVGSYQIFKTCNTASGSGRAVVAARSPFSSPLAHSHNFVSPFHV